MEDGGYRKNQRLECFFNRYFGKQVCDTLRISEPCIVVGENYAHAFKFVTLSDDKLFILANPPQNESDIELSIKLQSITAITHVSLTISFIISSRYFLSSSFLLPKMHQ